MLIQADLGLAVSERIIKAVSAGRYDKEIEPEEVKRILAEEVAKVLKPVEVPFNFGSEKPFVILVVGVNGAGKTTTIGKLGAIATGEGFKVMFAACDTFRAAAIEQLTIWGERIGARTLSRPTGSDSSGLAYDAMQTAKEDGTDILFIDTAGRLQNKAYLMDELDKIVRVVKKQDETAPHAVLLVLDATTGQNAISQAEIFTKVAGVTGLIMTKLDGTARGGILVAIAEKFALAHPRHRRWRDHRRPSALRRGRFCPRHFRIGGDMKPLPKFLIEMGPLLAFFIGNWKGGVFWGTGIFMVATAVALAASWITDTKDRQGAAVQRHLRRHLRRAHDLAARRYLHQGEGDADQRVLRRAASRRALLRQAVHQDMWWARRSNCPTRHGASLTLRWGIFFLVVAGLNELIWRNVSTDTWVNFKVFGLLGLTLVFALANAPYHGQAHDRGRALEAGRAIRLTGRFSEVKSCNPCPDDFRCFAMRQAYAFSLAASELKR